MTPLSFDRFGPMIPAGPVVLSVPHAGRDYPAALQAALLVPLAAVRSLEDRHVDRVALAALGDEILLVQRQARAWIDLNRREDERDPAVDEGAAGHAGRTGAAGAKLRNGLGLVPRRANGRGELWRRRWTDAEIAARVAADHRPYHAALTDTLAAARRRFGTAVLVDLHSMPPLPGVAPARIVVGDRHETSADAALAGIVERIAAEHGVPSARNRPYAGGHVIERHGRPADGIHAVQIELDRSLYLDAALDRPVADGVARMGVLIRAVLDEISHVASTGLLTGAILAAE
ncbi:N-formylglutamate amidohydrolase [uncultured Sphingomonas sp.]|uniref:N-formylglutamate amidohydrolase n=1 Tax=uncultured Sphingomonas sp. TaxID=158754 RepID=UPI0035CBF4B5